MLQAIVSGLSISTLNHIQFTLEHRTSCGGYANESFLRRILCPLVWTCALSSFAELVCLDSGSHVQTLRRIFACDYSFVSYSQPCKN